VPSFPAVPGLSAFRSFTFFVTLGVSSGIGCSNSGDAGSRTETSTVADTEGKRCEVERTGATTPRVTCDAEPRPDGGGEGCIEDTFECFRLLDLGEGLQICAGCCNPRGSTAGSAAVAAADCSPIVCNTRAECPFGEGECVAGRCASAASAAPPPADDESGLDPTTPLRSLAVDQAADLCAWYVARTGGYEGFEACGTQTFELGWNDYECEGGSWSTCEATVADVEDCAGAVRDALDGCTLDGPPDPCARILERCPR